ncbi:serine hydrolase domain-containing protein [Ruminococcus albus]|uniref:Beta-lactamase n=1 Tax=Ruminococcus albus (strain ATCC 27210 / DSM 20455 / JCM 14654 / NCDO 2250 / 7) TaxID=697329 RepID=E6UJX2_RUMA7|nr:serine hydrolase domain-containing protein [Ruminococcus albus]ADU23968.1 beta-lactamase [Ruminococcus albus 7 = DSM 20455]
MIRNFILKAIAVTLTLPILIAAPLQASAADTVLDNTEWSAFVEEKIEKDDPPGLAVTLVNGSEVGFKNWGYANIEEQTSVTEDTVFGIGSCSKAFTALSVFLLQEEGKLSVEDSVSDYLPWWIVTWNGASQDTKIWQLLEHCSGISNTTMMQYPVEDNTVSNEEIAHIAENIELVYEPETRFEYCNLGYDILAYITETVSGQPFEEYVTKEILQPIGMIHSGYHIPTTQGYRWLFLKLRPYDEPEFSLTSGDGGLRSTPKDMSLWIEAQLGHLELPEKLTNAITASQKAPDVYKIDMGNSMVQYNGWIDYDGFLYHTGTNANFSSFILVDKERDIGIFSVSNVWTFIADYAGNSLYQVMKGEQINREQFELLDPCSTMDKVSSCITIVSLIGIILVLFMMFTQRKRLDKKQTDLAKEKKRLCKQCCILVPLLVLTPLLPRIAVSIAGYGFASYKMIGVWFPYSFLIAFAVLSVMILMMIISSVTRYFTVKKFK